MTRARTALLLVGSPKPACSTSEALGSHLLESLSKAGFSVEKIFLLQAVLDSERLSKLLVSATEADLVILAYPTYVDTLPAPVIRGLEELAEFRRDRKTQRQSRFLAIANCGFPEPVHNAVSLAICRQFALAAGYAWVGGLSLGGGGALGGYALRDRRGMVRNIIKALDMTAQALAADRPVPEAAAQLMARPLLPRWLYLWVGSYGWKRLAKRFHTRERLADRPLTN